MKTRWLLALALFAGAALPLAAEPKGKTVVHVNPAGKTVVHHGPRKTVVVHKGFPLSRPLPRVVIRPPGAAIRVAPRVFLAPVVFPAVVVKVRPAPAHIVWYRTERFVPDDDWTEVALNVSREGAHLYFEVADGRARVSFAEVVFDDGEAQVVDFGDRVYAPGFYGLLDLPRARNIDHVRLVAVADGGAVGLSLHLAL